MNNSILGRQSHAEQQYPQTATAAVEANAAAKLDRTMDSADALVTRVQALADAICGRGLSADREIGNTPAPAPDGILPRLMAHATALQVGLANAHTALDRIERELM